MPQTRKDEQRFLTADEQELVADTHHPRITKLSDAELAKLQKLVRERRDRASDISRRQRREMRGKGRARGAAPAAGDTGTRHKVSLLAQAMKRLNSEAARRERKSEEPLELTRNMRRALAMKQAAPRPSYPASRTADEGMRHNPNQKPEQITDPREVGRVSQFVKEGQARRDT